MPTIKIDDLDSLSPEAKLVLTRFRERILV